MNFSEKMIGVAHRLIEKYGVPATLKRATVGSYDPATSSASKSEESHTIQLYEEDVSAKDLKVDQTKHNTKKAMISVLTGAPQPTTGDKITYQAHDWAVTECTRLNVNGIAIVYNVVMQK